MANETISIIEANKRIMAYANLHATLVVDGITINTFKLTDAQYKQALTIGLESMASDGLIVISELQVET